PGFKKEDLDINFEDGYLTVKAEVNNKKEKKDEKKFVLKERFNEKLSRTYYLGDNIDTESIKANLSDGVLEVTCKKVTKPIKNILID
ncbi:MAG: Hsp20/alpha crystallin family protein, partial [Bacilli bacterium]|nr:Hsp20/alpha crystallin family protein [Bacilli bacterium]